MKIKSKAVKKKIKRFVWGLLWKTKKKKLNLNYEAVISRVKSNHSPCRVVFLVRENQKWSAQSLYDAMENDVAFCPIIAVSQLGGDKQTGRVSVEENYRFFSRKGMEVVSVYDNASGKYLDLRELRPDIVFYDQPYWIPSEHSIKAVSEFALTCYLPYGYGIYLVKDSSQTSPDFFPLLWRCFIEAESVIRQWDEKPISNYDNYVKIGYPKVDPLIFDERGSVDRFRRVIYAPHHSLEEQHHNRYGTFLWSGQKVLELARRNKDVEWVFKPHPKLKQVLVDNGLMTLEQVEEYYSSWDGVENRKICDTGDYLNLFASSDLLITDSASFLMEYLFTGKPIIHLISSTTKGYGDFGESIVKEYYKAFDQQSLADVVEQVVLRDEDFKKENRLSLIEWPESRAGERIMLYLKGEVLGAR